MDFSFEGLLLLIVFVFPGFTASYLREARKSKASPDRSALEIILLSVEKSLVIFAALAVSLVIWRNYDRNMDRFVAAFFGGDLFNYARENLTQSVLYFVGWVFLTLGFAIVFSKIDILDFLFDRSQKLAGTYQPHNFWVELFRIVPKNFTPARPESRVTVWLKDGPVL